MTTPDKEREGLVYKLRASAQIQSDDETRIRGRKATTDRAELMRQAADFIEKHCASEAEALARAEKAEGENVRLRERISELIRCGNGIVGASMNDEDAAEAFEMWDAARVRARAALKEPS